QVGILLDGDELAGIDDIEGYQFTADERYIILDTEREQIYRHSYKADFTIYNRTNNKLTPVFEAGKKTRLAALSPDGTKVAFVYDNNLYYQELRSGQITQVTSDGEINKIINGATDWVYEEEFGDDNGFFWSPDSKQIAYYRFDESEVPEFTLTNYRGELYPEYVTFKYPKVGEKNSEVSVHIYDLAAAEAKQVAATGTEWEYFPRIKWTPTPGELCVFHMNRHQNKLQLEVVSYAGKRRTLLREENKYYIDIHDNLTFLNGGKQFVWTSEQDGWNHIYLYNMNGKLERQLTSGEWEVTNLYGIDQTNGTVFFQAAMESPMRREIYSLPLKGNKKPRKLAGEVGTSSAQFSGNYDYFVLTFSTINRPPRYSVVDRQGKRIRLIEDNADLQNLQQTYQTSEVEFFDFPIDDDGLRLNGYMIKPKNFNPNIKYPLLMYVYGGPGSQQVVDSWRGQNYWWFQMLAQQGFIVACVDNRGTGARGEEFKKMTYQQLGKYETEDQIAAARYLGGQPYIDGQRMGI
ncbi:MAG: S9 family peptidase, partial [Bacteroidetes bacterium]